ncbi:MAG: hypothetical protein GEU82_02575 [Luteitalea sp.]|nr:hypothetical protein [Luteitalea sp.]
MLWRTAIALLCLGASAACDNSDPAEPPETPPASERITGNERFGWTQAAASTDELASIQYAAYVDGSRVELAGVGCDSSPQAAGFSCSAPLPPLAVGNHTLELASFVVVGTTVLEGPRSSPLRVTVGTALVSGSSLDDVGFTTVDGVAIRLEQIADDLEDPTDIAFGPDGRAFVAEANATIRILGRAPSEGGGVVPIGGSSEDRLLAVALDPAFAQTHHLFALVVAPAPSGSGAFMLVRFREHEGALVDRVTVFDEVPAAPEPHGSLRFGPDGKLYVALDDGGVAQRAGDLASRNGKVLRMNADGSTPDDQANLTPVFSHGFRAPQALTWQASGHAWLADESAAHEPLLYTLQRETPRVRGRVRAAFRLPAGATPSAAMFYRGRAIAPFENNLFVASAEGAQLLRFTFDVADPLRVVATERLLNGRIGPIQVVAQGPDGSMYVATRNALARVVVPR